MSETFQYDQFNRLTSATIAGVGTKTWSYDGLGNIRSKDGYTDYNYGPAGGSKPHAVKFARGSSYSYDLNGNMETGGGRTITWNSANLPTRIVRGSASAEFSYGPDRARYRQVSVSEGVTTTTLYVGKLYEQETKNGVVKHKNYISAGGRTVAIRETANGTHTTKYLHQDHLGSTDVITDAAGQVLERQSFDAFGARRIAMTWRDPVAALLSALSTRGYTGHEQLDSVGLIHMNGRVYDPQLGRFLSADPIVKYPEGAQGLNRYSYVDNNPLSRVDPSGYGWFSKTWKKIKKWVKPIVAMVAAIYTGGLAASWIATSLGYTGVAAATVGAGATLGSAVAVGAAAGAVGSFVSTAIITGDIGQAFKAGAIGGITGGAFGGISYGFAQQAWFDAGHQLFDHNSNPVLTGAQRVGKVISQSVIGGAGARLSGGSFEDGVRSGLGMYALAEMADFWRYRTIMSSMRDPRNASGGLDYAAGESLNFLNVAVATPFVAASVSRTYAPIQRGLMVR